MNLRTLLLVVALFSAPLAWAEEASANLPQDTQVVEQSKIERTKELLKEQRAQPKSSAPAGTSDTSALAARMFGGLVLALGILSIGVFILKKISPQSRVGRGGRIKIIEKAALTPKSTLILAEIDGRTVLIATGADKVSFAPTLTAKDDALGMEAMGAFERDLGQQMSA